MNQKEKRIRMRELRSDIRIVSDFIVSNRMNHKQRSALENLRQLLLINLLELQEQV